MIDAPASASTHPSTLPDRTIAWIIGAASLLAIAMMAHHPATTADTMEGIVAEITRKASTIKFVHGSLAALLGVLLFGFTEYSMRDGANRPLVRAALVAYVIGVIATIGAALAEGFVATDLAMRYSGAPHGDLEPLRHSLRLCWYANQASADLGEFARATAMVFWSTGLLRRRRSRMLGACGGVIGCAIALAVATGALQLDVHGALLAVLVTLAWNLGLALQLWRGRA